MTEILFYHLTETKLEETLASLLERCLARNWRAVVQLTSRSSLEDLDTKLWTISEESFIPHGSIKDETAPLQPIFLTLDAQENPNGAQIRFCLEGANPVDFTHYQRLVVMFNGDNESELNEARMQWKAYKAQGGDVTYWQQNANRGWEKKA